jgi:hypothetical protein
MADYKLTDGTAIIRTSDNARIPADPDNMDYVAYQAWLAVSNTPDPYVATPLTPQDQFNNKLAAGMNATWTVSGIGAENNLNALYAVDPQTQFNITAESVVILTSGLFSNGTLQRYWLDKTGVPRPMSIAQFKAFAMAVSAYVNGLYAVMAALTAGQNVSWPTNAVTINA